jgi:hypothetical protein
VIKNTQWWIFFVLLGLILRFFSFFISVIDHDDSTYLVIAKALTEGQVYWVDIFDTKPIGIFLIYGFFMKVLGLTGIPTFRILGTLFIASTSFFIFRIISKKTGQTKPAFFGGLAFLLMNSTFTFYGISPNTETYFTFFTGLAAMWVLIGQWSGRYFLAGLMLGIGFVVKYVVLFDMIGLGLVVLLMGEDSLYRRITKVAWMALGSILPFFGVAMWYWIYGHWDTFYFHAFEVSGRYPSRAELWEYPMHLIDFLGRFFIISMLAGIFLFRRMYRTLGWNLHYWLLLTWFSALIPGKFFGHYFIQSMIPMSLMFGLVLANERAFLRSRLKRWYHFKTGVILFSLWATAAVFFQKVDYWDQPDTPKAVANYLKKNLGENDYIYTSNSAQIIYYLLDKSSPVPYVHPSLFWQKQHLEAMEIPVAEIIDNLKKLEPKYIITKPKGKRETASHPSLEQWIKNRYAIDTVIGKKELFQVYELQSLIN